MEQRWHDIDQVNPKDLEKNLPQGHFVHLKPIWFARDSKLGLHGHKPATYSL
jgi:hypothetical protein